jgi:type IV pilus assembly protein PilO
VENLDEMSPFKKNTILILPVLLIVIVCVMYFLIPLNEQRISLSADVDKQKAEIELADRDIQKLNQLMVENEIKKKELVKLEAQLPAEKEVSELLKQVSDLGIKAGLDVVLWRPGARTVHSSKDVYEIPVSVEMRGSYHSFGYFFGKVTEEQRVVTLNNITLKKSAAKGASKSPVTLSAVFTAKTYSSISEEEKKALAQAEKAEKGKKK